MKFTKIIEITERVRAATEREKCAHVPEQHGTHTIGRSGLETIAVTRSPCCTGVAGALLSSRFVSSLLYGVKATDHVVFIGAALLLTAVALVAAILPARRASHIDPMTALRRE